MKIILKENIENLGSKGDIVNVAAGYGRNYLLPKKLALEETSSNMKMIEMEQASLKKNLEKVRISYQDDIQKLNDVSFSFKRKAGEKDTIFGSVSVADIKEELDKLGFEIEKKKILLKEPIKRLGNYTVPIKVFLDDIAEIKVQVVSEGAAEEELVTEKPEEETAVDVPEASADKGMAAEDKTAEETPASQEDKEAAQSDAPAPDAEEKPEPEPEVEKKKDETEEEVVEAAGPEETVKEKEKDESNEKNKTSQ